MERGDEPLSFLFILLFYGIRNYYLQLFIKFVNFYYTDSKKNIFRFYIQKKEKTMQINSNFCYNKPSFNARLRLNSTELERAFSLELDKQKCYSQIYKNIEKFKQMEPNKIIEGNLIKKGSEKVLELYNTETKHIKSFDLTSRGSYTLDTFYKAFEFLTSTSSKKFWSDDTTKGLFA